MADVPAAQDDAKVRDIEKHFQALDGDDDKEISVHEFAGYVSRIEPS